MLSDVSYNPDVLSCLANLSSDEVFTPPGLVNKILDMLPSELWSNREATFLDPVSKSGVFLREIAKRLNDGLVNEIPDQQERINHIFTNQVFGIALTELTALLSRRSVYCAKKANSKYSVCSSFQDPDGNIKYENVDHSWVGGKCSYCGATEAEYGRDEGLEKYAYNFLHTNAPEEIFKMKFDVIIGNPPYQLSDGGAQKSATPIYHRFIEQAKKLEPRYLSMIVPARWYAGGKGLDDFRKEMLSDTRIKEIHDFPETSDCFPGVNIRGGVCYFLWDREYDGDCKVSNYSGSNLDGPVARPLLEPGADIFIRYNKAISILHKVYQKDASSFSDLVSAHKAFGLRTYVKGKPKEFPGAVKLFQNGGIGFIEREKVEKNEQWIDKWKVVVPYASPGTDVYPHRILSAPLISPPGSCSTETYLVVGPFENESECENVASFMRTSLVRFLILLAKPSQHITSKTYKFVPQQDWSKEWTDESIFAFYGIEENEIEFIDTLIQRF